MPAPAAQTHTTTLQRFSFGILIAFLFMIFSRVFDVQFSYLHLPGFSYRLMGMFLLITGTFLIALRDTIGKCIVGFTFCFLAATAFSMWKGGSFRTLMDQWLIGLVVFLATAALVSDWGQYMRTVKTVAFAVLVLTIICVTLGTYQHGRLFLERGRFANPNEMAQALLLGLPFWWALFSTSKTPAGKIIGAGALGLMTYVLAQTGSRGALISALVVMGFIFLRASIIGKMKLVVGVSAILLLTAAVLPGQLRARYHTFFSAEPADNSLEAPDADDAPADASLLDSAVGSTSNRMQMLVRSLILTARHPLFGVGPGVFPVAENEMAKAEGRRRGAWLGTHNTFTQVSSECGIPAFLFYSAVLVLSWRKSYALYRRTRDNPQLKDLGTQALALNYSLIAFFGTGLFVHAAYSALLPVLSGLTVALVRTTDPLFASEPAAASTEIIAPVGYRAPAWRASALPAPWSARNRA